MKSLSIAIIQVWSLKDDFAAIANLTKVEKNSKSLESLAHDLQYVPNTSMPGKYFGKPPKHFDDEGMDLLKDIKILRLTWLKLRASRYQ